MNWLQRHWDARAAANFMCGGTGAGLIILSTLSGNAGQVALGLVLIGVGLSAVWLEIGRKLRAINVFFNPFTSWMTRESFAAALVFGSGLMYLIFKDPPYLYGCAAAALAFLWCQARILHGAKGIPAWRAPQIVPLIVFTGLAEGAGLALLFSAADPLLAALALAVVARAVAWRYYRAAVKSEALGPAGDWLLWLGTAAALGAALAAYFFPVAAPLAGVAAFVPGWRLKLAIVTRAAFNQGFSLPRLPVRGAR